MFDKEPDSYDDIKEWFAHFRLTKHLPGMEMKLRAAMRDAPDNRAARFVMTAYAAAALDVSLFIPTDVNTLARDMKMLCGLKPEWLQTLSVKEIAAPMKITAEELQTRLRSAGFEIDADGTIGPFTAPVETKPVVRKPPSP